jgi:Transcriptional Coactivator p15 (PC4)
MNEEPEDTVFLEWKRSRGEVVRLVAQEYHGQYLLHLRVYYSDEQGDLKPSGKGVTIPFEQLKPLRLALKKAEQALAALESQE